MLLQAMQASVYVSLAHKLSIGIAEVCNFNNSVRHVNLQSNFLLSLFLPSGLINVFIYAQSTEVHSIVLDIMQVSNAKHT